MKKFYFIAFLVIASALLLFIVPKWNKASRLSNEYERAIIKLNTAQKKSKRLNYLRKEFEDSKDKFEFVQKQIPEDNDTDLIVDQISKSCDENGLSLIKLERLANADKDFYSEIPLQLQVSGSINDIVTFIEKISELQRLLIIKNIRFTSLESGNSFKASFVAVAYKFIMDKQ